MSETGATGRPSQILGRYVLFGELASGGMATVHLGRLLGPAGFTKTVAIKRLHAQYAKEPEFVSMFLDEARLAARIQHPNVVATLDVVPLQGEVYLVMDYVEGEALSRLLKACAERNDTVDVKIAAAIVGAALQGLHAAHEANDERGRPLGIVHRDVSPQNVLVGSDGIARVLDFGVAKARGRLQSSREGQLKGKLSYMAPEQVHGREVDRRTDVYAASVMLWEVLTGKRMVAGDNEAAIIANVVKGEFPPPSQAAPWVPAAIDALVLRGLAPDPAERFQTAREMAIELDRAVDGAASAYSVGEWVARLAGDALKLRATRVREMESSSAVRQIEAQRNMAPPLPRGSLGDLVVAPPPPIGTAPPPLVAPPASDSITPPPGDRSYPFTDARPTMPVPPPDPAALAAVDFVSFENADEPIPPAAATPALVDTSAPVEFAEPEEPEEPEEFVPMGSISTAPTKRFYLPAREETEPVTPERPRRPIMALAMGLIIVAVLVTWWIGRGTETAAPRRHAVVQKVVHVEAAKPAPPPMPQEAPPTAPAAVAPPTTAAVPTTADAPAEPAPVATPEGERPAPRLSTRAQTAPRGSAKPKRKARCNPPFYLDSEGVKHIKPECL